MASKEYFYIVNGFEQTRTITGNLDHQAKIEAHSAKYAQKYKVETEVDGKILAVDSKIKSSRKIKRLKDKLAEVGTKDYLAMEEVDQEFETWTEKLELSDEASLIAREV